MDSFELNKIAGGVLGAALFAMGLGIVSEIVFHAEQPAKPGFVIEVAEAKSDTAGAGESAAAAAPIAERLKGATADAGKQVFSKCGSCHNPDKGGKNGTGPNLWNVVGGPKAHADGFAYSAAIQDAAKAGGKWGYDELDQFLANPQGYIKGTKMSFAGLKKPEDRAAVIMYLHSLSDAPIPLP